MMMTVPVDDDEGEDDDDDDDDTITPCLSYYTYQGDLN